VLTTLLLLSLGTSQLSEERLAPRVRATVALAGSAAYDFRVQGFVAAPGISAEVGVTLADRVGLTAQVTATTIAILTHATAGVNVAWDASDRWTLSAGFAAYLILPGASDLWSSRGIIIPLGVVFAPMGRQENEVGRRGLSISAQLFPGVVLGGSPGYRSGGGGFTLGVPITFGGALSIGYAWR
jgi:hypothetical protein